MLWSFQKNAKRHEESVNIIPLTWKERMWFQLVIAIIIEPILDKILEVIIVVVTDLANG